jgi:RimJ/RimL family protein N-acetyltransferase
LHHVTDSLKDGTLVRIRPIRASDKQLLAGAVERLSAETRYLRFMSPKPRLSSTELRYLTEVDQVDHIALVAVPAEGPECILGVARAVRLPGEPELAEFAIVVGDALQGRGLGRLLSERLVDASLEQGIRRFTATVLAENVRAIALVRSIGQRLTWDGTGVVREYVLDLAAA